MTARILLIGLDSFDGSLMRAWAATGDLPNLKALFAGNCSTHPRMLAAR